MFAFEGKLLTLLAFSCTWHCHGSRQQPSALDYVSQVRSKDYTKQRKDDEEDSPSSSVLERAARQKKTEVRSGRWFFGSKSESRFDMVVKDNIQHMQHAVYAHHDAVLKILATEEDRDLYIDGFLEAYDENFQRPLDGNAKWTSLYKGREDRANLENVKKFLDVQEFTSSKIALVNVVAPQANALYQDSYTMGPAYDDIANKHPEVRYNMIRHTYEKEMLLAIAKLRKGLNERGFDEKSIRTIVPIIGSAIYSPYYHGAQKTEDCKNITQIIVESLLQVEELNKEGMVIELTFPSHWKGPSGVEEHMMAKGLLKGLKARVQELPDFRSGPAGDITAIIHSHMKDAASSSQAEGDTGQFLILGGAGNFLRFKGGAGKDTKVPLQASKQSANGDDSQLNLYDGPTVTPKVVEEAEAVEGAQVRFARRGWALHSGFQDGGSGLEEFTIYGLLGSKSSKERLSTKYAGLY